MTRKEIREKVQSNLEDAGAIYHSATTINEEIQRGYSRFAYLTGCISKAKFFPFKPQPYWTLRPNIGDFLYLNGVYDDYRNKWLTPTSRRYIRQLREDWELWVGSPEWVVPIDYSRIAVVPHLTSTSGQCIIHYSATADTLADSSIPQLPITAEYALEYYTTAKLLANLKEFGKATEYWKLWLDSVEQSILHVNNLAKVDRLAVVQPYIQMGLYGKGSAAAMFIDDETPAGTLDGTNDTFTLSASPSPADSLQLYVNGQLLFEGVGYVLSGNQIVYNTGYIPAADDEHRAWYRVT